ncbi:Scr1 family TA system antitoxin-like transcriptional regulator [Actinokineospora sp. PR83]|uniref:helix-turn-helix domain-containing protein n=1 Tax=Actinokineospora sp. PR83 TaxID=2884908 RepID=UPI0027E0F2E4|nr:helix-turn-helix transcriptional regulator [Actinokineospora sp. PR83]MCG8914198.1 Scr1 family TA system antitoxin-like transcriptional regulator [Actinokineospora sp. PR83]
MSGQRKNPQARDRTIGAQLKAVRLEQTPLNLEAAARAIGWSTATLSRTENGKRHITSEDVAMVLAVYGVPMTQRGELIESARAGVQAGWWSRPLPGVLPDVGTLASYEASASALTDWSLNYIPGLLQTEQYATSLMIDDGAQPQDVTMLWLARQRRQAVVPKVDYVAFLHENALRMTFGGSGALREQLDHLVRASHRGQAVRVVRGRVPHRLLLHPWLLLHFADAPPVLHVELHGSSVYLHDDEVDSYVNMRSTLDRLALSTAESRSMIEQIRERL